MKMIVTTLFLTSLLLTSCALINENNIENTNTNISIQDMPTADEIKDWERNEIYKLRFQAEQIPLDTCEEYFANEITAFLNSYETVELDSLIIEQDNLSVVEGKNRKSFGNLKFEININLDMTDNIGSNKPAVDISQQLLDFIGQYSYFNFKAYGIVINCFDLHHTKFYDIECRMSGNETIFVNQPKDEFSVQTLAFNFHETNPNFILKKFGVVSENNELYVEYHVSDDYFDYSNMKGCIADLEQIGIDIHEYLLSENITKKFILSKGVNLLTISFYSGNFSDSNITFNFEL